VGIRGVDVGVDQVDRDAQVVLGEQLILVVTLQARRVVVDEPGLLERIGDEFGIEGNVGQCVAVLYSADQVSSSLILSSRPFRLRGLTRSLDCRSHFGSLLKKLLLKCYTQAV